MARDLTDPAIRRHALQDDLRAAANAALQVEAHPQGGAYTSNPTVVQDPTSPGWVKAEVERIPYIARGLGVVAQASAMAARRLADTMERVAEGEAERLADARRLQQHAETLRTLAHVQADLRRDRTLALQAHRAEVSRLRRTQDALVVAVGASVCISLVSVIVAVAALVL